MYVTPNASISDDKFHSLSDVDFTMDSTGDRTSIGAITSVNNDNMVCDSVSGRDMDSEDKTSPKSASRKTDLKTSGDMTSTTENKLFNSDGSAWRPLPPLPSEAKNSYTSDKKKSSNKKKISVGSTSNKQEGARKLPDISQFKSKNAPPGSGFQSNFMRKHLGSPSGTESSEKEGSSSPEMKPTHKIRDQNLALNDSEKNKKKKITVDHAKLRSVNSVDNDSSSQNEGSQGKKKIRVDTQLRERVKAEPIKSQVSVGQDIDNIPFADDSEDDMLDDFHTPATSVKHKPPKVPEVMGKDVRKRILPIPPKSEHGPQMPSTDHIRKIKKAEIEKAKKHAREKARLKSDEELGLKNMGYTPRKVYKTSTSCTPSTSDFVSDSDDAGKILHSTPVNVTNVTSVTPTKTGKVKKKKKKDSEHDSTPRASDKSDSEFNTSKSPVKKKKSLINMLLPKKSPEKSSKGLKDKRSSSNDTLEEKSPKKKKKTPKSDKKKKKHMSESALEHLDKDLSELSLHGVVPRFTGENNDKHPLKRRPGYAVRRTMPPKADCKFLCIIKLFSIE